MNVRLAILLLATATATGCVNDSPHATPAATSTTAPADPHVEPPPAASSPVEEVAPAFQTVTLDLSGTILLRPAGDPVIHEGHAPEFMLTVPNGTRAVRAHAEWSPPQIVGLEFQPPGEAERIRSWDEFPNTQFQPPIDMDVPGPLPSGDWWAYIGPSTVGGALSWKLTITMEIPRDEAPTVQVIECASRHLASPLGPRAC